MNYKNIFLIISLFVLSVAEFDVISVVFVIIGLSTASYVFQFLRAELRFVNTICDVNFASFYNSAAKKLMIKSTIYTNTGLFKYDGTFCAILYMFL